MAIVAGEGVIIESVVWAMREDFFKNLIDVSTRSAQIDLAERLGLPIDKIQAERASGAAFAALDRDAQLKEKLLCNG